MKPSIEQINLLNSGQMESRNLMDALAVDFNLLCLNSFENFSPVDFPQKTGFIKRMQITAKALYDQYGFDVLPQLLTHKSDTIRSFACYVIALHELDFTERLQLIKSLANDHHFGVREWAWIAIRNHINDNLMDSIELLTAWTVDESENIRRFASEATRPRGVWCSHLKALRSQPWLALQILEPLKADPAKYVQLSVANWLNDAGKDHPDWVKELCGKWLEQHDNEHTKKICKRALRNFR